MDAHGFCVRIDARDGYLDKINALKMCADYLSIVGVLHKGATNENPHYHLVVRTVVKDQAFRVRMKKIFDQGKGNGHMSIKPWDGCNDAISYFFHEDRDAILVIQHNVSDQTIAEARERNDQVQRDVEKAKQRASWRLEDEVYEQLQKEGVPRRALYQGIDVQIAKKLILTALRLGRYVPNDFLLRAMVRRIRFRLLDGDDDQEEQFALAIAQNLFSE